MTTAAGLAMLSMLVGPDDGSAIDWLRADRRESLTGYIDLIETEARASLRAEIVAGVAALPAYDDRHTDDGDALVDVSQVTALIAGDEHQCDELCLARAGHL